MLRLKIFLILWSFGKCLSTMARNLCLILVLTFLLNGGLYQRMLFYCLSFRLLVVGVSSCRVDWYPRLSSAFWYGAAPPYQKALEECFLIWRGGSISISTQRMQIPVHSTLWTTHNYQTKKPTTEQHTLVQPPSQQKCQLQYQAPILCPSRQAFPERPQT